MNKINLLRKFLRLIWATQYERLNIIKMFNRYFNKEVIYNYREL
jgi:hypothetical protein